MRWLVLLVASIFFYWFGGSATLFVPAIIILCTYSCGYGIEKTTTAFNKKMIYLLGLSINLGLLIFYKYINFFIASFFDVAHAFHVQSFQNDPVFLHVIVPLGISYISFQAIGYLIEIHRGNQLAEKHLGYFATYLLFFPKLLSGPIERAHHFIPQLKIAHTFNEVQFVGGLKRILWGMFLKLVIANRIALYTDAVFNNSAQHSGITLWVAALLFTVQLFADFSGYTDMAIGSAQLLGFQLIENFDKPFMAKSVTEFWRRWHISLTTWVNEYIYNPIVVSCRNWNKWAVVFAGMVTFLILGFWHGPSWNYIIFGFLQGFILAIEFLTRKLRKKWRSHIPDTLNSILGIAYTFIYFSVSVIFFKVQTAGTALNILKKMMTTTGSFFLDSTTLTYAAIGIFLLLLNGIKQAWFPTKWLMFDSRNSMVRYASYLVIVLLIVLIGVLDNSQFIYFQY
ncbi:MAG: MBOAT family O-acyltransferase [Ferruginibacter sp.]